MSIDFTTLRALALRIAPELQACSPLYFVSRPAGYPVPAGLLAFASAGVDSALRRDLVSRGEWQGQGSLICLVAPPADRESLAGLMLHEISHLLPAERPWPDDPLSPGAAALEATVRHDWAAHGERLLPFPWTGHNACFLRRAIHLRWRAAKAGRPVPFPAVVVGWHYGLRPLVRYAAALADEPQRFAAADFATIQATPAPIAFSDLFANDVRNWMSDNSQGTHDGV